MPRSGAKSQAGKSTSRSSIQVTPPPTEDLEVEDLNPACLNEAQWTDILIQEDADETVGEIMEELLRKVMGGCLEAYIKKQLIAFSASWATSYITQTVEQRLLCLDEGEGSEEASKTEDSEPVPAVLEAWAQGCLPVVNVTPQPEPQQEVDVGQIPAQTAPEVKQKCNVVVQTHSPPKSSEKEARSSKPFVSKRNKVPSPCPSPNVDQKKKQQMNLPPRPAQGKLLPPLPRSAEQLDVRSKDSRCSVSKNTCGSFYQGKDNQTIPRLDPASLPRNCILPQYKVSRYQGIKILHTNSTKPNYKKQSGPSKLEQRQKKQPTAGTVTSLTPLTSSKDLSARFQRRKEADYGTNKWSPSRHSMERMMSSGPLRLDQMELAKGVVLLDPQAVDLNSFKVKYPNLSTKMRVIQSDEVVPLYSVEEITAGPPPQVIPLFQSKSCDA